ncbi:Membrane protein implicated in regulation of membrane protease activity [Geodermatophilus dictyosporus]|uniref:Membrane protein implicated in regulation of membrane protease activity n=1 Tax=Geodermatophilus dictyosporus TaxID=1523247 RepID=A0A1I5JA56_9ACTN|nr:NfeD family protein [Geodermatophilus dictyosporus]SFO69266.1 Membrane protein implicated in regulation of membrane protease activity [Geodermatophilus dictyosporus]
MAAWVLWLVASGLFVAGEVASGDLVLLMLAGGALGGSAVALAGGSAAFQIVGFIVVSAILLSVARPAARARLEARVPGHVDGVQALVGRTATVTRSVGRSSGRIQVGADEWSARTQFGDEVFDVGTTVRILEVQGATAVVGEAFELG